MTSQVLVSSLLHVRMCLLHTVPPNHGATDLPGVHNLYTNLIIKMELRVASTAITIRT